MRKLRLTEGTLRIAAEWSATAPPELKRRLKEMLRSLEDGTWNAPRWFPRQYSSAPEVFALYLDTHVYALLEINRDETKDLMDEYGEVFSILNEEPPPEPD